MHGILKWLLNIWKNLCTPGLMILFYLLRCLFEYKNCTKSVNVQVCFCVALLIVSPSKAVCTDGKMCYITYHQVWQCISVMCVHTASINQGCVM